MSETSPAAGAAAAGIDLNSDLGESFGAWKLGHDEEMLTIVTSANVACGFHAGDPGVMRRTVALAARLGVSVGAHPGFADLVGFGRRAMALNHGEIVDLMLYQIGALQAIGRAEGAEVGYVKVHGALYNQAERDQEVAYAVAEGARQAGGLPVVAAPGPAMERAAAASGVRLVAEAFADRAYDDDGHLVSRAIPGSVITDPEKVAARVVRMALRGEIESITGSTIPVRADTICLHGDTPGAPLLARAVRSALERAGVEVARFA